MGLGAKSETESRDSESPSHVDLEMVKRGVGVVGHSGQKPKDVEGFRCQTHRGPIWPLLGIPGSIERACLLCLGKENESRSEPSRERQASCLL